MFFLSGDGMFLFGWVVIFWALNYFIYSGVAAYKPFYFFFAFYFLSSLCSTL